MKRGITIITTLLISAMQCSIAAGYTLNQPSSDDTRARDINRLQDYAVSQDWNIEIPQSGERNGFLTAQETMQVILEQARQVKVDYELRPSDSIISDRFHATVDKTEGIIRTLLQQQLLLAATDYIVILEVLQPAHPSLPWFKAMTKRHMDFKAVQSKFDLAIREMRLDGPDEHCASYYLTIMRKLNIDEDSVKEAVLTLERTRVAKLQSAL